MTSPDPWPLEPIADRQTVGAGLGADVWRLGEVVEAHYVTAANADPEDVELGSELKAKVESVE